MPEHIVALTMTLILKTALQFLLPLTLIWLVLGLWLLRMLLRHRSASLWFPGGAWLLFTVMTCTPLGSVLLAGLENQFPKVKLADQAPADAILCLGGGIQPSLVEPAGIHLKSGADRMSTALTLAAAGKAPLLILGGGGFPHEGHLLSEADAVRDYLRAHVTIPTEIHSLGVCSDTHDEAVKVAALMQQRGLKQLLLVTSAAHMPRSLAVFRKAGVNAIPVPCNYMSSLNHIGDFHWLHLPHVDGFDSFNGWLHEFIGHWVYRMRGWL